MTHHPHPPFSSGPWTVHPASRTLSSDGLETRVGHKVMAVQVCLVAADGELVTKDQLVERVWQGAFTTDEAVATVVYELRKALGDDARRPSFVETIRKGGYRWLAEVTPLRPPIWRSPPPRHAVVWALGLAAALALVFGVASLLPTGAGGALTSPRWSRPVVKKVDPRAAEAYDLGSYFLRQGTPVGNRKAQDYFLQAIERQPAFAAAYAGLASSFVASTEGLTGTARSEAFRQARESAQAALAIDDELAAAHASLANVSFRHSWDWRAAEDHFRRGLAAADQALDQTWDYAFYLAAMGRHAESISVMRRVVAAEPTSKHARWALGRVYYLARRFDEALVELAWAGELDPAYLQAALLETEVFLASGHAEAAIQACQDSLRLAGDSAEQIAALAVAFQHGGLDGVLRCLIEREVERGAKGFADPVLLASLEARRGATEPALAWLSQAYASHHQDLVWLQVDPAFDSLRNSAEYRALLSQLGLGA